MPAAKGVWQLATTRRDYRVSLVRKDVDDLEKTVGEIAALDARAHGLEGVLKVLAVDRAATARPLVAHVINLPERSDRWRECVADLLARGGVRRRRKW